MSETAAAETHVKSSQSREDSHCTVANCKRPYRAKGYCITHYKRWRAGAVEGHKTRYKICTKEACKKPRLEQGSLCAEHAKGAKEGAAA